MSLTDQPVSNNSAKKEHRRVPIPPSRLYETGPAQPLVRLTVSLPGDLVDRLRNAVYWSPSLKLAWLIAQSLRTSLTEMVSFASRPIPTSKECATRRATSNGCSGNETIPSCQAHQKLGSAFG